MPFVAQDALDIEARPDGCEYDDRLMSYTFLEGQGPAFTLRIHGRIIACFGAYTPWRGLAQLWCVTSVDVLKYRFTFHKASKWLLHWLETTYDVNRVEAGVYADNPAAIRWIWSLGFKEEAVHRLYGPNKETFLQYAYFPKEK